MTEGICTERDWRRGGGGVRYAAQPCWGAACIRPSRRRSLHTNRVLHAGMLLCSLAVSACMGWCFRLKPVQPVFPLAAVPALADRLDIRHVPGLSFSEPVGIGMSLRPCTAEELYRGKLLLLDEKHTLPAQAPVPTAVSIATYGKGMVPVNDLSLKCGRETILALANLFGQLREAGAGGFTVWRGTVTGGTQEAELLSVLRQSSRTRSLESAVQAALANTALYAQELRQPYTVELRMPAAGTAMADETPLEESVAGRQLLRLAWRNGFIRTGENGFLFRYVGKAHATAMTYLNVGLKDYLTILHHKRQLTIQDGSTVYYIQCVPAEEVYTVFQVPSGAACEVSMDNTGYAVAACTFSNAQ